MLKGHLVRINPKQNIFIHSITIHFRNHYGCLYTINVGTEYIWKMSNNTAEIIWILLSITENIYNITT
jgi:hypothetical protein